MQLDKDFYTIKEVAAMFDVTIQTVYDWMNRRGLRWVRIGARRRIPASALEAFVQRDTSEMRTMLEVANAV